MVTADRAPSSPAAAPPAPALGRRLSTFAVDPPFSQEPGMLNLMLTEERGAAAAARQALCDGNGTLPAAIRGDVLLLVSELVTNAVRHAGAGPERPLQVQVLRGPRWLVVSVEDEGPGFAPQPTPSPPGNESGGWGLFLVDQIADRWGVECTTSGSRVWFEIAYEE